MNKNFDISEINERATTLRRGNILLLENPADPDVNKLLTMLTAYAETLFSGRIFVKDVDERKDLAQKAIMKSMESFKYFDPDKGDYCKIFLMNCRNTRTESYKKSGDPRDEKTSKLQLDTDISAEGSSWISNIAADTMPPIERLIQKEHNTASPFTNEILTELLGDKSPLTHRQKEVLQLFSGNLNQTQIAAKLGCAVQNVNASFKIIKEKVLDLYPDDQKAFKR